MDNGLNRMPIHLFLTNDLSIAGYTVPGVVVAFAFVGFMFICVVIDTPSSTECFPVDGDARKFWFAPVVDELCKVVSLCAV